MASCDRDGRVRAANPAFLEFLGVAGDAGGLELRDSALPEVYPTLFDDLEPVATTRRPIKRVIYLNEGGDRVVEAAIVLSRRAERRRGHRRRGPHRRCTRCARCSANLRHNDGLSALTDYPL